MNDLDPAAACKANPVLAGLPEHELTPWLATGARKSLAKDEFLYQQDEPLDGTFCLLVAGSLKVWKKPAHFVRAMEPGALCGECAHSWVGQRRSCNVQAADSGAELLVFNASLTDLEARFPLIAKHLRNMATEWALEDNRQLPPT